MTSLPTMEEVMWLHHRLIVQSGGADGLRDAAALESALAQPEQTFGDQALYPDVVAKAAALGFFLICNHPFVDGNKRIGHAAMEVILADLDEQERTILAVAAGELSRESFTAWVRGIVVPRRRCDDS